MTRLTLLALAALLAAGSALAQVPAGGGAGGSTATGPTAAAPSADSGMMADLAEANIAEIQTGKLALEKSKNEQVRSFAQQMVDEHGAALKDLQALAQRKGLKLPDDTDLPHKALATALRALSGDTFDSQYIKRVGIGDHERTIKLLQKIQADARDADMKALAGKMLPTVQKHLQMAQQMDKAGRK